LLLAVFTSTPGPEDYSTIKRLFAHYLVYGAHREQERCAEAISELTLRCGDANSYIWEAIREHVENKLGEIDPMEDDLHYHGCFFHAHDYSDDADKGDNCTTDAYTLA
jgi:hypothetical protein